MMSSVEPPAVPVNPVDTTQLHASSSPPLTPPPPSADSVAEVVTTSLDGSWHPFDLVSQLVESVHVTAGLPYWAAIVATTLGVRVALIPLGVKAVQNSARMAVIRPHLNKLTQLSQTNPSANHQKEVFLLWKKNNVNPFKALVVPLVQLPLFIAFFFGIRQMGAHYADMSAGGLWWFPDLAAHDPYFLLPLLNGASFLLMVELNAVDQAAQMGDKARTFKNAMRGLSVFMVPVTLYTPAAVFMYWIPNNIISLLQTRVLRTEAMMTYFDIPKPPPVVVDPFEKPTESIAAKIKNVLDSSIKSHTDGVQVIQGDGAASAPKKLSPQAPTAPPPVTYKYPPKKNKSKK